jgi:hypothetical protein
MTIGTQIIVDQDIDRAVTLLFIPYGIRNILVLVIGRNEFIINTANHSIEIKLKYRIILNIEKVSNGINIIVRKKIC